MSKGFWAWKKRFALFPTKIQETGKWIWLKPYYRRNVFTWTYRGPIYTTSETPYKFVDPDNPEEMVEALRTLVKEKEVKQ